ncbi:MAG: HEAT repeat domain-containing protein [Deltaproteobacteria bacterium]|nr:MAG: HEAT repeat domain-containing protein [Deltaproteobacteria bacterium]
MTRRHAAGRVAALALVASLAAAAEPPRLLEALTGEASLIVIGRVTESDVFARGNLFVHTLAVESVLKGRPSEPLLVLEERLSSLRLYRRGQRVLAFLRPAPEHSFFRENLPPGTYVTTVAGRDGVTGIAPEADAAARAILSSYADSDPAPPDPRVVLRRELRSGHARFVADAAAQLERRPDLARSLAAEDREAIAACLRDPRVDDGAKAQLLRRLGAGDVPEAAALLQAFEPASGGLVAARAEALARLGFPPGADETASYLRHPEPAVRSFAVERLAERDDARVVAELESVALFDRDAEVRLAAIEALGRTGRADAADVLARSFDSDDARTRRASARALHELGGAAARDALRDVVYTGSHYEIQAHALLLLFSLGVTQPDAIIERIRTEHPDPRIRRLIEEGIGAGAPADPHPRARRAE